MAKPKTKKTALSGVEWIADSESRLRKRFSTIRRRHDRRFLAIMLIAVLLIGVVVTGLAHLEFSSLAQRGYSIAPSRADWQAHVDGWRWTLEANLVLGGLGFLLAVYLVFAGAYLAIRLVVVPQGLRGRLLTSPAQRSADLVIDCVDLHFSGRVTSRFFVVTVGLVGIVSLLAFLCCRLLSVKQEHFLRGAYWFFPVGIGLPFAWAVRSIYGRTQRVLAQMKMLDADVRRFLSLRFLWFVRSCLVLVVSAAAVVWWMPYAGGTWTHWGEKKILACERALFLGAPQDIKKASLGEFDAQWRDKCARTAREPLSVDHWKRAFWPAAWRALLGAILCVTAIMLVAGIVVPKAGTEWRHPWSGIACAFVITLAVSSVVGAFWGLSPRWELNGVIGYGLASLVAFCLTYVAVTLVDLGRRKSTCPYCSRTSETQGDNCAWCGVRLDIALREGPGEFLVSKLHGVAHHRECSATMSGAGDNWSRYGSLSAAMQANESRWPDRIRACRRCLGVNPTWGADPAWTAARKWVRKLGLCGDSPDEDS